MQTKPHDARQAGRSLRATLAVRGWLFAALAAGWLLACAGPSASTTDAARASTATETAEPADTPPADAPTSPATETTEPASREPITAPSPGQWEEAIRAFEAADAAAPPPSGANLFLGSSSIRLWDLRADFEGFACVQRGFGGSEVADSVRYASRIALPYEPRVIVFYAGDNDIANGKDPERVLADFRELVELVHRALPDTRIVFISIKPSVQRWALAESMRRANELVRALAERDPAVEFVDVWPAMLGADGRPRAEYFMEDGLHLSRDGYRAWAELVRPWLAR
ncbi:MAG: hypothetical protein IT453_15015 [Planctomycetes bacterium]|nr:hypothetical protein [Planctomycetota bacterium]